MAHDPSGRESGSCSEFTSTGPQIPRSFGAALVSLSADRLVCSWSADLERLLGYGSDDVIGRSISTLAADEDSRELLNNLPLTGTLEHLDARLTHRDGAVVEVALTLCPVVDTTGRPAGAALIIRKVSSWEYLAQSQLLLQELIDGAPAVIYVKDLRGRYQMVNRRFEEIAGTSRRQAIGRRNDEVWPASVAEKIDANDQAVIRSGQSRPFQELIPEADGTHTYLSVKFPLFGSADQAYGVAGVSMDITELKRADEAVREAERSYRLLFDSNPQPMWVYDSDTLQFVEVNEAAVAHYGYSRDEFLEMTIRDIRPPDDVAIMQSSLDTQQKVERSGPWRHRKKDGSLIAVEITSHEVTFRGRAARFVLASDVTDRERLQQQVHQSQRLESLGQLAGGVAHDFNNLLAVILNYADFLKEELAEVDGADDHDWTSTLHDIDQIRGAGERAARLTHQLLAFARRDIVEPVVLDLNDVVARLEPLLRRTISEDIALEISRAEGLDRVVADEGQLEQILVNLVVNARDAMPGGGTVSIETANLEVDASYARNRPALTPGPYVLLRVSDNGTGMTPDILRRAFEPFFTTKAKGQGTGLGLATIYGIVTQAGGDVGIYSEPGLGSTFTALFPATDRRPSDGADQAATESAPAHGETVLVVEDEDAIREVALRVLERHGYHTLSAARGPEALEIMQGHDGPIDLLLTDVIMPAMHGEDLASAAQRLRPGLPVLYMSGYSEPAPGSRRRSDTDAPLIVKPFTQKDLLRAVQAALS